MANKVTRKDIFEGIKATLQENFEADEIAEYVEFIDNEIAHIDERAEKEKARRAAKKAEGDALRDAIKEYIDQAAEPITAEAIAEALAGEYPEITKAKVTYRANALAKDEEIDKTKVDKKVAYAPAGYVAAEGDAE